MKPIEGATIPNTHPSARELFAAAEVYWATAKRITPTMGYALGGDERDDRQIINMAVVALMKVSDVSAIQAAQGLGAAAGVLCAGGVPAREHDRWFASLRRTWRLVTKAVVERDRRRDAGPWGQ